MSVELTIMMARSFALGVRTLYLKIANIAKLKLAKKHEFFRLPENTLKAAPYSQIDERQTKQHGFRRGSFGYPA
jgi:hypothetical protein